MLGPISDYIIKKSHCEKLRILDVGCATGDFLYYLSQLGESYDLFGGDIRGLLEVAKTRVINAVYLKMDILRFRLIHSPTGGSFDVTTMFGVNAIFDDCDWVTNLSRLTGENAFVCNIWTIQ